MHGLGDQGAGWASHAPELKMPWVKWIFPNAPNRAGISNFSLRARSVQCPVLTQRAVAPVTINMGAQMPAWADIKGLSPEAPEDEEGTMQTRDMVQPLPSFPFSSLPRSPSLFPFPPSHFLFPPSSSHLFSPSSRTLPPQPPPPSLPPFPCIVLVLF
eukprot:3778715-Rhodomonas_salina.2